MKVLPIISNQIRSKEQQNDVNFKAIWVYKRDAALQKMAHADAINLTKEKIYSEHIPAIGKWIVSFVRKIQKRNINREQILQYQPLVDEFPDLVLVTQKEKTSFRRRLEYAEREIATSKQKGSLESILDENLKYPTTACGQLRKLIENLVLDAVVFYN